MGVAAPPIRVGGAALFAAIGLAVLVDYAPTSITEPFGPGAAAGLLVVFLLWLAAVTGWGRAAEAALGLSREGAPAAERWALALALGSLVAACWGYATAAFGSRGIGIPSVAFLAAGAVAFARFAPRSARTRPAAGNAVLALRALVSAYVVLRFIQSTRLARHGDPLYYHLVAPVSWVRSGSIAFDPAHPLNFAASLWEGLYLWPAQWFLGSGDKGLPAIQIFAEWTHLTIGWLGMGLAAIALLRRLRFPEFPALLGGFAALATRSLWWTGALAKNDCGASLWLLAGTVLLWNERPPSARRCVAAGALVGAAFVAKYTTAFVILPLAILWSFGWLRRDPRRIARMLGVVAVGGLLSAGPLLLRNALGAGSPLFPLSLGGATSASLSESSREYIRRLAPSALDPGVSWRLERLAELALEGPLAATSLLTPVLLLRRRSARSAGTERKAGRRALLAGSFASLLVFLLIARRETDFRLLGPGIVLLNVGGTMITLLALRGLSRASPRLRRLPAGLLTLAAVASTSRLAPEAVLDRARDFPLQRAIAQHTGGDTKLWIVSHLPRTERIVTSGDNEIYYLLGYDVRVASDDLALDRLWRREFAAGGSAEDVLVAFRRAGFDFLLDTRFPGEAPPLAARLRAVLDDHPGWVAFRGRDARLVDLHRVTSAGPEAR